MGFTKLTGGQAILGGATILNAPTIYSSITTSSTGTFKIYGVPTVENTATDATLGAIKLGGVTKYIQKCSFTVASWTTAVTTNFDTGKDIPAGAVVSDAWFDITAAGTSGTLTAGTNLDPDGFLTGINIQTATARVGSLTLGSETYGALLTDVIGGTSNVYTKVNYVATGAKSIAIGRSATTLTSAVAGSLYVEYLVSA